MGTLRLYNFVYKNETKCSAEDGSVGERELVLDVDMAATGGWGRRTKPRACEISVWKL